MMHEKPSNLPTDGYNQQGKHQSGQSFPKKVHANRNSGNSNITAIEKYRSVLNLPNTNSPKSSKQNHKHKITITDQAAKLIALSIKGLLNS